MTAPTAYPLAWPNGWPRTPLHRRSEPRFSSARHDGYRKAITLPDARDRLSDELNKLGASLPVLSTNLELRLDGRPRANAPVPTDPGVAVYFQLKGKPIVLACDRWNSVPGNVAAIAAHISAMRGMDRWGVGSLEQMFTGFTALPSATSSTWRDVLGLTGKPSLAEVDAAWRRLAAVHHPDRGGDATRMAEINAARDAAHREQEAA